MTALVLYDDAQARSFEPFALTRPLGEMRAGSALIRHRWERALDTTTESAIAAPHLADFDELDAPPVLHGEHVLPAGTIVANSRCVVSLGQCAGDAAVWTCDGRVAAVRLGGDVALERLADGSAVLDAMAGDGYTATIRGRWLDAVWDFIAQLIPQLQEDIEVIGPRLDCVAPAHAAVSGTSRLYVERGAVVEPLAYFDVSAGAVLVRRGATVRAFTRLAGPCIIASGATVQGERISGCAIGERSIVHGEMSETIVLGHANKAHDGFVGHSYLGRWVNLGAGTITSNLKNTYGVVALWTPQGVRSTGLSKLGTLFGDHVKTGIGLRLTTGSVIGSGSNVYGSVMPPKYVPPFSWGEGTALSDYEIGRFLTVAERVMARRGITLSDRARRCLSAAHAHSRSAIA
ncbi:MAG TPA: putative sugar nucleotidyl transferase [Gemmatimonadaceae bacterium]|nr:putative sugar nucleotidyl transferase [Gemmatimonadaceae bacterium]